MERGRAHQPPDSPCPELGYAPPPGLALGKFDIALSGQ